MMITVILTAIFFGGGVFYLDFYNGSSLLKQVANSFFIGALSGILIGLPLSFIVTMLVSRKYIPIGEKIALLPFSDGETYLVRNEHGNIFYRPPGGDVLTAQSGEIVFVEVRKEVEFPYFTDCRAETNFFWGIFVASFLLPTGFKAFTVPNETMIRDGWVNIKTKQEHELALV